MRCSGGVDEVEPGAGGAIYKKNAGATKVDTVGPVVETEMVKLTDTQPDTADEANNVSCLILYKQ